MVFPYAAFIFTLFLFCFEVWKNEQNAESGILKCYFISRLPSDRSYVRFRRHPDENDNIILVVK